MIGQFEAPPLTRETLTMENVVQFFVIPWLIFSGLSMLGIVKKISWREAFAPMAPPRRRRRRR